MDIPVGFAGVVLLVNALTELVKKVLPEQYNRFVPLGVEALGFGLGLAIGLSWFEALFVGLSAMGLYSGAKAVVKSA
ncbi:MAG: transposase [Alphaproteobacteria bacterium]|nr:transposase [Alphaproteobacteria bacterium]